MRTLSDQVSALAEGRPDDAGPLAGYLDDAQVRVSSIADRLEQGGPQGLLDDVTAFARRRPIVFLAAAGAAGFLAGRLARAGHAVQQDDGATSPTSRPRVGTRRRLRRPIRPSSCRRPAGPRGPIVTMAP